MMNPRPLLLSLALLAGPALADTLFKCTESDGRVTYTNNKGAAKNCIVISRDKPVSTFATPKGQASAPTPGDFPKVGSGEQKARDGDRRAILEQELANEQKSLDEAKKTLAQQEAAAGSAKSPERLKPYQDTVQLHERNIEALKKEMGAVK
jgi:hypothetical protein